MKLKKNLRASTKIPLRECKYQLSIGMIVKNEERILRRCLEALKPLREAISCELIITDTGSTDSTIEIAKEFADKFIEFEWCDDFSKARNTGVELSEGSWFMFLDADEVFDESVLKIAEFINQENVNTYDRATIKVRNYADLSMTEFNDFTAMRLFNFSVAKRNLVGAVHETIPGTLPVFNNETVAHHDGYIEGNMPVKNARNRIIMEKELECDPNNLRLIYHMLPCCKDIDEIVEICKKGIAISKETNDYNLPYLECIYMELCGNYFVAKKFDLLKELSKEYLEIQKNIALPGLQILYVIATMNILQNNKTEAVENLIKYHESYIEIEKNNDYIHQSLTTYSAYKQECFIKSYITLSTLYFDLGEKVKAKEALLQSKAFEYEKTPDKMPFVKQYLQKSILFGAPELLTNAYKEMCEKLSNNKRLELIDLISKLIKSSTIVEQKEIFRCFEEETAVDGFIGLNQVRFHDYDISRCSKESLEAIRTDENIYNTLVFSDALYATLKSGTDVFGFYDECSSAQLNNLANKIFQDHNDLSNIILQFLLREQPLENQSIKVTMFHSYVAFICIVKMSNKNGWSQNLKEGEFAQLNEIFTLFVNLTHGYMSQIYVKDFLVEETLDCLPAEQAFAFCAHEALIKKSNSNLEYVKGLKKAVKYCSLMNDYVLSLIADVQRELEEAESNNEEFKVLGIQIKQSIRDMINIGNKKDADGILMQYSKINPSDHELLDLLNEIEAM